MGGTMLLGAAIHAHESLDKVVMLAAPWDFHGGTQTLLSRMKFWAPSAMPYIAKGVPLPVEGIQTLFASLDPAMAARKFSNFVDMDQGSEAARLFVATEDWLNEGVALPAEVARECIEGWFFNNITSRGEWVIGGKTVDPAKLRNDLLIVSSKRDRLVEYDCAAAMGSNIINPECGHIGLIAGKTSIEKVWKPIAEWIKN
jgi:polyhydroxyalkanoate synthase